MSQTKMTLTAGFTGKLSVSGGTVKSWTSKNKSIAIVDKKGKTVATHKVSKLSTSLSTSSAKTLTFTIKKSELKNKKIDLRNASIKIDGTYLYRY